VIPLAINFMTEIAKLRVRMTHWPVVKSDPQNALQAPKFDRLRALHDLKRFYSIVVLAGATNGSD
jgi:hypothetical protein